MTYVEQLTDFPVKTVEIQGQTQAYREAGQGDVTLVLLHGISSGSGSWVNQLADLGQTFRIIAWDAPGYGQSDGVISATPNATDFAVRLKGLFDALAIQTAIVVGHSLGALQASAFAYLYPASVVQLVIANVAQGYAQHDELTKQQIFEKRPKMLQQLGAAGMAASRGPYLVYKQDAEALALIGNVMANLRIDGFRKASYLLAYDEIRNYLTDLKVPCVVIAGEKDGITPVDGIQELVDELNLHNFQRIADAGHLSYVDQPEAFKQIILTISQES